jgi:hypothetical protein
MSRPIGSKNKADENVKIVEINEVEQQGQPKVAKTEPKIDETISFFEASQYLKTSESTIKIWIDHGHLESINGRIPMRSITMCKFNSRKVV